jgi:hypothetical protein
VDTIANLLTATGIHVFVAAYDWVWPLCETLHFICMAVLIGTIGIVDLRILGVAKGLSIHELEKLVPIGVVAFLINATTGFIFIAGNPVGGPQEYLGNLSFQLKMLMVAIAGINVLIFYFAGIERRLAGVPPDGDAPGSAKVVAAVSLFAWFGVILFGRFLMYNDTLLYFLGL